MRMMIRLGHFAVLSMAMWYGCAGVAQGPPGRDRDNPPPGHGGVPPGQAKKQGYGEKGMPPGQAKKYGYFRFREEDRPYFYQHYRGDADHWRDRRRPVFVVGEPIGRSYTIRSVPQSYWVNVVPPPPPGCRYGYYGGYVVAYDPTTRIVADVLDLISAARLR